MVNWQQNLEASEAALRLFWRLAEIWLGNPQKVSECFYVRLETHLLPYTNNIGPIATQATKNPTFRIEDGPLLSQGARGGDG